MKDITLEKVDLVIERTGVTYAEGKEALEVSDGDVLEAIIYIENKSNEADDLNKRTKEKTFRKISSHRNGRICCPLLHLDGNS